MRRRLRTPRALPTPMRIDFHAHILPHADHGCDGVPTARRQLDLMRAAGIGAAVAVAHFYPHRHTAAVFLRRRDNGMNLLHSALREGDPRILAGAEVLLCAGLEHMEGLERLSIAGSGGVLLLELPYTHPAVRDVQVIGVPDRRYGEEILACVVLRERGAVSAEELREYIRSSLARHKVPRYIEFVDGFPMNAAGKVLKYKMREEAVARLHLEAECGPAKGVQNA